MGDRRAPSGPIRGRAEQRLRRRIDWLAGGHRRAVLAIAPELNVVRDRVIAADVGIALQRDEANRLYRDAESLPTRTERRRRSYSP